MEFKEKDKSECLNNEKICTPGNIIDEIAKPLNIYENDKQLDKIKDKLDCETESCILNNDKVKNYLGEDKVNKIFEDNFKPEGPRSNTNLLNNSNIDDVLESWTKKYPRFYHIYYQMIDFDKVGSELSTLDILKIVDTYDSMGVVINTDVSSGGGIHWFCLYCDFKVRPIQLEYFNSSGNMPRKEIQVWLTRTKRTLEDNGYPCVIINASRIVHQQDSETECGPYSLYYIKSRLLGIPAEAFNKKRIPDKKMIEFRQTLFRHE